ncbi:zinc-binding dehydrogenase [Streptomyces sp. NBC_01589]|uniref:zinc-binding dehydrogenase n=1 Tax=unclassified Streptomyces TaxID=2593676 RepID=UPI00386FF75F
MTLTPNAGRRLRANGELDQLETLTGLPVRDTSRLPTEARPHPVANCYVVAPASVRKAAGGRPVSVALDPIGGKMTGSLMDLLAPGGKLVSYGMIAEEPISVHAPALVGKSLTLRGRNIISGWPSETSPERRASDIATAKLIALALAEQFDVVATYGLGELADAVEHAVRPGKVGTVLVRP